MIFSTTLLSQQQQKSCLMS